MLENNDKKYEIEKSYLRIRDIFGILQILVEYLDALKDRGDMVVKILDQFSTLIVFGEQQFEALEKIVFSN